MLRDLRHADGGFFSAEDADSEGIEGKFYLLVARRDRERVRRRRRRGRSATSASPQRGNFVDPHTGFRGNILHVVDRTEDRPDAVARGPRRAARRAARTRVRPGLDDKVLLGWNALFLRALAEAAAALDRDDWMDAARTNARFLLRELRRDDGRLLRSWQDGRANLLAYAEDYAALLEALLTLAELDDVAWLAEARAVADELVAPVRRRRARRRSSPPAPTPKRSSCARRTSRTTRRRRRTRSPPTGCCGSPRSPATPTRRARAERWVATLAPVLGEHPTAFAYLLGALERLVAPAARGRDRRRARRSRDARRWSTCSAGGCCPASVRVTAAPGAGAELTPLLADRAERRRRATAYVCERFACRLPVTDPDALRAQLDDVSTTRR